MSAKVYLTIVSNVVRSSWRQK